MWGSPREGGGPGAGGEGGVSVEKFLLSEEQEESGDGAERGISAVIR